MRKFRFFFFFLFWLPAIAQQVPIGEWRSHLPYSNAFAVAEAGTRIYCATLSGLFFTDKSDGHLERISTINGLAEVSLSAMKYNRHTKTIVLGYANGNVDLLDSNNRIINLPFIKEKNITGNKSINNITMIDDFAYLSCGFGVVVVNLLKKEISETFYIGVPGTLDIIDLTYDGNLFYAATTNGIYTAPDNNSNLGDYTSWQKDPALPGGVFNTIAYFNNKIYTNYSPYLTHNNDPLYYNTDTIYVNDGGTWTYFDTTSSWLTNKIESNNVNLVVTNYFSSAFYDTQGNRIDLVSGYAKNGASSPRESIQDKDGIIWIADLNAGLVKNIGFSYWVTTPNGPANADVWSMISSGNDLWVSTGGFSPTLGPNYSVSGLHLFSDEQWTSYNRFNNSGFDTIIDIMCAAVDPRDNQHVFAGCWGQGLLELHSGNVTAIHSTSFTGEYGSVGGMVYDGDNNLWIASSASGVAYLTELKANGTMVSKAVQGINGVLYQLLIDSYGQKWAINSRGAGLCVINDKMEAIHSVDSTTAGANTLLTISAGAIALDLDGQVWIGTTEGVGVIYSPGNVATNGGFDAQKILVEQDGHAQYLLETETVTAIAVDGDNRKWFGTSGSGVYLMSSDGTQQLLHFTAENSPLFSNAIISIAINGKTGEVFFGTEKGIISYRGTATDGNEQMTSVSVFPNPVREGYSGLIGIKGLVQNAAVKITDISGTLVYETIANGGQAVWDGKNLKGEKAHTGIYLVFCAASDGSQTIVSKILFVN